MSNIDKEKFAAFIAMLRKEKGLTQKELAGQLAISDKAVSKWETAVSVPNIDLLMPLPECLVLSLQASRKWGLIFLLCLLVGCLEALFAYKSGGMTVMLPVSMSLGATFGIYFCFFVKEKLPAYYDENRISLYVDGVFEMNLAGLSLNNRNWGKIVTVGRVWSIAILLGCPILSYVETKFFTGIMQYVIELPLTLFLTLGGFFIPIYIVGKKYG